MASNSNVAAGMFNFGSVMDQYYGYTPSDDAGRASKLSFQGNMIQSAFDSQLGMQNAAMAQEFELDSAKTYADLELRNQKALMADNFKYGMQKMEAEFGYQSKFSTQVHGQDIEKMGEAGEIQQDQTKLEGVENRMTLDTQGKIDLKNISGSADADIRRNVETVGADVQRATDIAGGTSRDVQKDALESSERMQKESGIQALDQIGAAGSEAVRQIGAQAAADQGTTRVGGEETRKTIGAQTDADVTTIGAQGTQDIAKIQTTGEEGRKTIQEQDKVDTKKENRAEARSRALARR